MMSYYYMNTTGTWQYNHADEHHANVYDGNEYKYESYHGAVEK